MNKKKSIWTPAFISIFIANFATNMGQYMMNTLIPKYVNFMGAPASTVGMVTSMFAITALLIRPVSGPAFDYFSKKKMYMAAISVTMLAFFGYSRSNSVTMMMIFRLVHGIGVGCTAPLGLAIASDSLPEDKMGSGIGIYSMGQAVATAIGPSIGLSLSASIGYSKTFLIGGCVMFLAVLLCSIIHDPKRDPDATFQFSWDRVIAKNAILPALIYVFLSASYSCINSFIAIYGAERGVTQIGLFFTTYALVLLFSKPASGTIIDKFGLSAAIVPACLMFILSFLIISVSRSLPLFLIAGAISACGFGACQPAIQAMCMKSVSKERRGAAANTNFMGADIGNLIGPVLAGKIIEMVQLSSGSTVAGYSAMYRWMTIPTLIALGIFLLTRKQLVKNYGEESAS